MKTKKDFQIQLINQWLFAISFRTPRMVTQKLIFRDGYTYAICPRCHISLERTYQIYCDRCGQALEWNSYTEAALIKR